MGKFFDKSSNYGGGYSSGSRKRPYQSNGGGGGGRGGGRPSKQGKYDLDNDCTLETPDWSTITLKPFKKDFYVPHENIVKR